MSNRGGTRGARGRQPRRGGKREGSANGGASTSPSKWEFRTDSDIAGTAPVTERKLEKWDDKDASDVGTLADGATGKWDQFEVNSRKFGVKDTYDEHIYTTVIDRNHPEYEERARRAEKLAREIEGQATDNLHLREERGQMVDKEVDEETKYSGVERLDDQEAQNRAKDDKEFSDKQKKGKKFNFAASAAKAASFRPAQPLPPPPFFVPAPMPGYMNQYGMMMPPYGYYPPQFQ